MLALRAYAKINLGLRILRLRNDGYHDLETIFRRINLFDEVELERADSISMECSPGELPADERNLSYRAAVLLQKELGRGDGVRITLKKNIPVGAGLGGGSSDAASTLLGLLRLWGAAIPNDRLRSVAVQLGSDVPYFLESGMAYATGRGDVLEYFRVAFPYWIVVVTPALHISTAWAYKNLKKSNLSGAFEQKPRSSLKDLLVENLHNPRMLQSLIRNDFEPLVLETHDDVVRLKRGLYESGADFAQLSGSGSAVYGLFKTESAARSAAESFTGEHRVSITPPTFDPGV
jgi:4-diphosphocytidyl-2-C-methyl-D-erythritol kinase